MKRLTTRGMITILVGATLIAGFAIGKLPNHDNYEVRTMRVYEKVGSAVHLVDGNNQVYKIYDEIEKNKDILVTVDNKGTETFRDDEVIKWIYKGI